MQSILYVDYYFLNLYPEKSFVNPIFTAFFKNCKNMKNLLLLSTFLLTTATALAQLTVKPNGLADSYVYVKDQVLYVTSDVNLTRNGTSNDQEASIYLRDNGQLIQGGTAPLNTGDGQLSVQQNTPVTNSWAYYYWCSPIGNPGNVGSPNPTGNRSFGVNFLYEAQPSISDIAAKQAATLGGRDGFTSPELTISTRWLYTFTSPGTEREGNYARMNGGNNAPPGFGFIMKGVNEGVAGATTGSNHDQLYEFRGRPNSGTFIIPVAAPTGVPVEPQMTLAGNPYPSALDLNKLFYDSDNNELGTFWYYDEDRTVYSHYYTDKPFGYGVYTVGPDDPTGIAGENGLYAAAPFNIYTSGGGNTGTTGTGSGTPIADGNKRYAPIGQGIMFVGDADGDVLIKNEHRVFFKEGDPGSIFQRPNGGNSQFSTNTNNALDPDATQTVIEAADKRTPLVRIWSVFDNAVTRDLVIAFYDQATDGYDRGLDGKSAQDLKTDAYFLIGNDDNRLPYVINGVKFDMDKQIPIGFKLNKATNIQLLVKEEIKKPYRYVYLYDSQENTYRNLSPAVMQAAPLNLQAGTYNNRFYIVFKNPNIKREAPVAEMERNAEVLENVDFFQNNPQQQLEISNPEGYTLKSASVYDMNGKLVISENNLGDNTKYSFYTGNLSDGVYLVKLMTTDNISLDYRAIVHNK